MQIHGTLITLGYMAKKMKPVGGRKKKEKERNRGGRKKEERKKERKKKIYECIR